MAFLTPEVMERRFWLKNYDNEVRPALNYPHIPAYEVLHIAATLDPDQAATDFYGTRITFWELYLHTVRLANGFISAGIKKGDRVGLMLPNSPQLVIAFWALLQVGAIVVNLNPLYTTDELRVLFEKTGMTGLVTFDGAVPNVHKLCDMIDLPFVIVTRLSDFIEGQGVSTREELELRPDWHHFTQFLEQNTNTKPPAVPIDPYEDAAVLQFTGGTTGVPKAATLTHRNLVAAIYQLQEWTKPIVDQIPVPRRAIIGVLPYFHVFGEICINAVSAITRSTQILFPRFEANEFMDRIEKIPEAWYFPTVATMLTAILNHPKAEKLDLARKFNVINPGAGPCTMELLEKARDMHIHVCQGFGMSETTSLGTSQPFKGRAKPCCIGIPFPDTDFRFVDTETGEDVPLGQPGELLIQSPLVMKGYWNDPEETAQVLRDGWLHTGDIAYMDEDGYVFIVDRVKDMIIAGGFNIYPQEVDAVLLKHPQVIDAMAVGIPDEYRGETLKAFVVLASDATVTAEDLTDFCRQQLAAYKIPKSFEFRTSLPRSAVGKALRRVLRDEEIAKMKSGVRP
jgi:long-chain acyl-CoA synthetase